MAYKSMLILSVLMITTAPAVHGSAINNVAQLNVLGSLFCTVNGNAVAGVINKPLAGVDVRFTCNGGKTSLAQLITNATGFVDSVVKLADGIGFDPSVCYLEVGLPVGSCTVLPPNGVLRAPVSVVSIVQTTVGAVVRVVGGLFAHA